MHPSSRVHLVIVLAVCLTMAVPAVATVSLPSMFSDHMVVQRDRDLPVWGWAKPGETVEVTIDGAQRSTQADDAGAWRVTVPPLQAEDNPFTLTVRGENTLEIKDVLAGEVWICSGQSNMFFNVARIMRRMDDPPDAAQPAADDQLRLFKVERETADTPQQDVSGQWAVADEEAIRGFSAVGYYFGQDLRSALDVPVGLIQSAWGGTPADAWTSWERLAAHPELKPIVERYHSEKLQRETIQSEYNDKVQAWKKKAREAKEKGDKRPRRPRKPRQLRPSHYPAHLYNAMIAPLVPFAIRGAVWYQGESNAGRAYQYRTLLPAMIRTWRESWGYDFPFGIVQLTNFRKPQSQPDEKSAWAELREAQLMTAQQVPHTGLAVIIDIGEADDIHPKNKWDVGKRLALWARDEVYNQDVVSSGPIYNHFTKEGDRIRLHFDHVDGGLAARGDSLEGFVIAGPDKKFHWADAEIDGDTVVVESEKVDNPVSVRYGWANNPPANLYNEAGLPATPFRTDNWPGVTRERR